MKPPRFRWVLALLVGLLAGFPAVQAQTVREPPRIAKIVLRHIGEPAANDDFIRAIIRPKEGDPYTPSITQDDVINLTKSGLFYLVRVTLEETPDGVVLTYVLRRNPQLTLIRFTGNTKFSEAKLLKSVKSKTGAPLKEQQLFADAQEIEKQYQKSGYPGTSVKYRANVDDASDKASVTFEIQEGAKIRIDTVRFEGAQAFTESKLRKAIKTRDHGMFSWLTGSGVLKQDQLEDDQQALTDFYRQKGYLDFELKNVRTNSTGPKRMDLIFEIDEGRPYRVGAINFTGGAGNDTNRLAADLPMKPGDTFTPKGLSDDVQSIEDFYGLRGQLQATTAEHGLMVGRIPNTDSGTMDLEFRLDPGPTNYVERIDIKGNWKTKDKVIRRELAISPGDVFDSTRVKLSVRRLNGLEFFDKVDERTEPTGVPERKNLSITVEEKSTGKVSFGAGFSSVDSLVGFVEVSQGNFDLFNPPTFTGAGQKFRLRTQIGTERQDIELQFIEPWFLNRKLVLDTSLYHRNLGFQSQTDLYEEKRTGARFGLSRTLLGSDFLVGGVSLTLEQVGIIPDKHLHGPYPLLVEDPVPHVVIQPGNAPQAILNEEGNTFLPRVGFTLSYGKLYYDKNLPAQLPIRGGETKFSVEYVSELLGGERDFYKIELRTSRFFPGFAKGHVFEMGARAGVAESSDRTDVPFYERYYLGGPGSLRGFEYREVSPYEPGFPDEPVGGDTVWFGYLEYSIPIIDRLRFAFFYDIGNVTVEPYDFTTQGFADNWGLGIRLALPIGPLRLDYGIPIHVPDGLGGGGQFQFNVGYTRNF